jgi:DNA invertase Pin-like site-specific DNA recombinase
LPTSATTAGGRRLFHVCGALAEGEGGVIRERTPAGLEAGGRTGGRPHGLSDDRAAAARAMMRDAEITAGRVAKHLGGGVSTRYRCLPGGSGAIEDQPIAPDR